jgi:tRNA1(Val) A37 N6-methylase TrmN6
MATPELLDSGYSEDALLGGRLRLRQPVDGYRAAIDPVLLAAAVPAQVGDRVLDVGAGTGAAALAVAARVPGCGVTGLERDPGFAEIARQNVALNDLGERVNILLGDLLRPPDGLLPGSFDHVIANPPYLDARRADRRLQGPRTRATVEGAAKLADWLDFCVRMARPNGTVTVIHRVDREDELLAGLAPATGAIVVFPLWAAADKAAKRVIVQARPGSGEPLRLSPGLVLHQDGGAFTEAADAVLRAGAALDLQS